MLIILRKLLSFWLSRPDFSQVEDVEVKDHLSAVMKMFDLRRSVDPRLKKSPKSRSTPICKLWGSAEALIANAAEFNEVLQNDGLTEAESIKRLLSFTDPKPNGKCDDFTDYIKFRLKTVDHAYLSLGDEFLARNITIAMEAAKIETARRGLRKVREKPSTENLVGKFSYENLMDGSIFGSKNRDSLRYCALPPYEYEEKKDWAKFQLRAKLDDEIWMFLHPISGFLVEQAVLVRQGEIVDSVMAGFPMI